MLHELLLRERVLRLHLLLGRGGRGVVERFAQGGLRRSHGRVTGALADRVFAVGRAPRWELDAVRLRLDVLVEALFVRGFARAVARQVVALGLEPLEPQSQVVHLDELFYQILDVDLDGGLVKERMLLAFVLAVDEHHGADLGLGSAVWGIRPRARTSCGWRRASLCFLIGASVRILTEGCRNSKTWRISIIQSA